MQRLQHPEFCYKWLALMSRFAEPLKRGRDTTESLGRALITFYQIWQGNI